MENIEVAGGRGAFMCVVPPPVCAHACVHCHVSHVHEPSVSSSQDSSTVLEGGGGGGGVQNRRG